MPKSAKTKKALIGSLVVAIIQIAAIIAENNGIDVPTDALVIATGTVAAFFGLDIAGHAYTDAAAIKNGKEKV